MRLFVAIDVSQEVEEILSGVSNRLVCENIFGKAVKSFHLTLKFIGETDKVEEIKQRLCNIRFSAFKLKLGNIGVFPSLSRPRVVWVGLDDSKELQQLWQSVNSALNGYGEENAGFKAHLTLMRVNGVRDKVVFDKILAGLSFDKKEFFIDRFRLYKSVLTRAGSVYETLAEYKAQDL